MNDFSELEAELKKLRPRPVASELAARIEQGLSEAAGRGIATAGVLPKRRSFRPNWIALGLGLAAAATFLLLARVNVDKPSSKSAGLALITPAPVAPVARVDDSFVPSALTQVVYDTKDEGLHFTQGADQPVRRLRSRKRETMHWNNPQTGASLSVSYPAEEVTLLPVSGQ
ncbi:MAG: hypothetical protein DLM73_00835 [Chthoniobacterales bacterium]|nr:MAG: hypothetical protein DLM73_00835 [Chthoniobacterales bacterium]